MPLIFGFDTEGNRSRNELDRPPAPVDLIPGQDPYKSDAPTAPPEPDNSGLDLAAAAFRQGNLVGSAFDRMINYPLAMKGSESFDPGAYIAGFEQHWKRLARAQSVEEVQFLKDKIRAEEADKEVIQQAGFGGFAATIAAGAVDPWTLASMALPVALPEVIGSKAAIAAGTAVKLSRAQRVWTAVAANAALDTAAEAAMHKSQELRTISDSLLTIGAGTFLTGALGTIATRVPKKEFEAVARTLDETLPAANSIDVSRAPVRTGADSAGAASAGDKLSLEDEGIATAAGRGLAQTLGQVSPQTRVLLAPVKAARRLIQELAHMPYLLGKHLKGIAGPEAIEDVVNATVRKRQVELRQLLDAAFAEHKAAGGALSHSEFKAAIARELDGIKQPNAPQASRVVQWARKVLDEDRARIQALPGYENFAKEIDTESYFPHAYDREKIVGNLEGFKRMLFKHFKENPLIPKEGAVEREKLIAARRQGVSDAAINLEVAQREAADAVKAYEEATAQLRTARNQAVGRGGAQDLAARAKRTVRAKTREAAKLKRQLEKLNKRLENVAAETPPRPLPDIENELVAARTRRKELQANVVGVKAVGRKVAKSARRLAAKVRSLKAKATRMEARLAELLDSGDPAVAAKARRLDEAAYNVRQQADAAERELASARAQLDELAGQLKLVKEDFEKAGDNVFDLQTERAIAKSKDSAFDTLGNRRGQILNRSTEATDELASAEALAKQLKQRAVTARKLARSLRRPAKEARKAKVRAEYTARKAEIPQRDDAEIWASVDDTVRTIMGENQMLTADNIHSGANALKSRKLDVPAEKLDPWLVRDVETVLNRYSRRAIPEIELRSRFGSSNLAGEIKKVQDEFEALKDAAQGKPNAAKIVEKLNEEQTATVQDLLTVLNRISGRSAPHDASVYVRKWVRAQRFVRTYNYIRLLGSQTVSSLSDTGRLVMRYGLPKTMGAAAKFLTDWNFAKLAKADMRRVGSALESLFDFRMQQMADLVHEEGAVTRMDKALEAAGGAFSRLTLMSHWNQMLRVATGAMEQDAVIRKVASKTLSAFDKAQLARAGIDDTNIDRLAAMIERHAETTDTLGRLRTELWEDKQMASLIERHILSLGDEVILSRGAGDLPAIMDKEVVKTWLQFRTFAIASVNRTMIPVAQGLSLADAKTAQGVATMLTLGAMTYYAKERISGREPDLTNPGRLASEAANWSGLIAFFPDLWDPIAKTLHLPTFSRFMSRSPSETVGGPTFGSGFNFVAGVVSNLADGTLKQQDIHGIRRMLPFQNLFYFSRLLNAIEGEVGEALGAEGSDRMDFTDRLKQETPSKEVK